ncbi:MAG: PQQ-dependent sugar dehydrogenase, partial [Chloroflexi bacterium]|nr:PQQ-dependent sugar dehydrogenase [Chloroflexota bacterium]
MGLRLPPGFRAQVLLSGLPGPTAFALDSRGALYIALEDGRILKGRDADGDGLPETLAPFAAGLRYPLGLAFRGQDLYVSSRGKVTVVRDAGGDGRADPPQEIVTGLPAGAHQNNGLAFGRDGKLYLPVGSTCNACAEADPRSAAVLRYNPDGSGEEVYARGLRNVYQLAFHPEDGTLWGADNGRDDQGFEVPEELNLIAQGGHYGWPDCWGAGRGSRCAGTTAPVAELEPRSSADGIAFYTGAQFPPEYRLNLFLTMYGAHSRATGMKLVRAVLARDAAGHYRATVSDFAVGFDRPLPVIVAPDGSLLVGDYGRGVIYRIFY